MTNITNHTLVSEVDKVSGNIIQQDNFTHIKIPKKAPGFRLVYQDNLREVLLHFNSKCSYIVDDLLSEEVSIDYELNLDYRDLMRIYKISKTLASDILTKLKKMGMLKGTRGRYKVYPFLVIPKRCPDKNTALAQSRWDYEE